jgi:hypothetical protein
MTDYSFDPEESLAVARLVWLLIFSDGSLDRRESDFFEKTILALHVTASEFEKSLSQPEESVYETIRKMPSEKRRACGTLLRLAVCSDEVVELSELSKLNSILEKAAIFRPDRKNMKKSEGGFS